MAKEKISTADRVRNFLDSKDNKGLHYNNAPIVEEYRISSDSIILDIAMDGGLPRGVHRFAGSEETGKSSAALQFAKNFQKKFTKNGMVIYIKAEGRLTQKMIERSGIDTSEDKWQLIKTNVFEIAFGLIKELILNNEDDKRYFIILDSADALNLRDDMVKGFDAPDKIAGGALMNSVFLKKLGLPIVEFGHTMIIISQVRTELPQGYGQTAKPKSSGGNAVNHYANFTLEFKKRYESMDVIWENASATKIEDKGNPIGHWCKLQFKKTDNEKTGATVKYPIKYGRTGGKSIWIEFELIELLQRWGYIEKSGSWYKPDEEINKALSEKSLTEIPQLQGEQKVLEWLEANTKETEFLFEFMKNKILSF